MARTDVAAAIGPFRRRREAAGRLAPGPRLSGSGLVRRLRTRSRMLAALVGTVILGACQHQLAHAPGTPEHAAALVSRGYDCGLRVERGRVVSHYRGAERSRFVAANQALAVRSYNAPRGCAPPERASVAQDLARLARR